MAPKRQAAFRRNAVAALIVAALLVPSARAQVKLEWRFKEGDTFQVERIYQQKQTVEVKNKLFKEQRTKTWVVAVTVKEKTAAGQVLDIKIESAKFESTGPAIQGGFDDKTAARMKGAVFTATVTPQGKLVKFDGYDAFIQRLAEKTPEVEKVLKVLLSEEAMREDADEIFNFLPDKAVRKGDKWKREATELAPPFGSFKSSFEYVLDDEAEPTIGVTIKMAYKPPAGDTELFRVVKGALKAEEGKGKIVFDAKAGRLMRSEKSVQIRGDIVIESGGVQTALEFSSENTLKTRVLTRD